MFEGKKKGIVVTYFTLLCNAVVQPHNHAVSCSHTEGSRSLVSECFLDLQGRMQSPKRDDDTQCNALQDL
jgi:hypothetical protein